MSPLAVLKALLSFSIIHNVFGTYWDISTGSEVDVSRSCTDPVCIVKCCGEGQVMTRISHTAPEFKCTDITKLNINVNYNGLFQVYGKDISQKKIVNKQFEDFRLVNNEDYNPSNTDLLYYSPKINNVFLLEDGTAVQENIKNNHNKWTYVERLNFCVDVLVTERDGTNSNVSRIGILKAKEQTGEVELTLALTGYTVSCVFMSLVVLVQALLPALRNIAGMMRMGYVLTLMAMYVIKITEIIGSKWTTTQCAAISTTIYFCFLSSFFWLNVMSFDIWWTFRGTRKNRLIHSRGVIVKFLWYSLYAWGVPLAITMLVYSLDRWGDSSIMKIHFDMCLTSKDSIVYYMYLPVIIMTVANCVLFLMTVYNIWLVKRAMRQFNSEDSRCTQANESIFRTYMKLSLLMGVSWVLDIIQFMTDMGTWTFYVNLYNFFIGIPIFIIFVLNRRTILMLCQKFNINNRYVEKMRSSPNGITASGSKSKSSKTTDSQLDTDCGINETKM